MAAAVSRRSGAFLLFLGSVLGLSDALFGGGAPYRRQLSVVLNPNAPLPPPGGDLLHVRAVGDNDTIHFLFCSLGAPTLLLVHTNTSSSTVRVDWKKFEERNISGSLRVEPESSVLDSTAIIFSRLWEYNDVNDTGHVTSDPFPPYELKDFLWSGLNLSGASARLCGVAATFANGSLCVQLSVFESEGRGLSWPRLLHSANSSQMGVWLDGVLPRAARSRFMLELRAVGGAYPVSRVEAHRSIDDEYTPSIFKVSRWQSAVNGSSDVLGFVQWKPVAYRRLNPALEDATPCHHSEPQRLSAEETASLSALVKGFYEEPLTYGLNISFGIAGEPFYNSTRFLSWTALVGVGAPPVDSFSVLVVSMMVFGLGTPLILLLLGGVCVCVRKRTTAPPALAYEPIN
ncbi:glycosylated lysosomal membrane protein [Halichoeres trimaculatus]|uniref:glycosylated lysosomal membrane protein n=1 Tax=Halichoeres trimaculatus TaxID=147232 RepID=UPI003D9DF977